MPVSGLVALTSAPEIGAPEGSVTWPRMAPRDSCANEATELHSSRAPTRARRKFMDRPRNGAKGSSGEYLPSLYRNINVRGAAIIERNDSHRVAAPPRPRPFQMER